jgi:hypothetical protein
VPLFAQCTKSGTPKRSKYHAAVGASADTNNLPHQMRHYHVARLMQISPLL